MKKAKKQKAETRQIGLVGVDSGLIWVGDPCYIIGKDEKTAYKETGTSWSDFCDGLRKKQGIDTSNYKPYAQFNYDMGHAGLGVCTESGIGDGTYPVFAEIVDGRVAKIWVDFM